MQQIKEYTTNDIQIGRQFGSHRNIYEIQKKNPREMDLVAKKYPLPQFNHILQTVNRVYQQVSGVQGFMVPKYVVFDQNAAIYVVMERGRRSLSEMILEMRRKQINFPFQEIKTILNSLLNAIQRIHSQNVFHGHMKPSNVIEMDDGSFQIMDMAELSIDQEQDAEYQAPEQQVIQQNRSRQVNQLLFDVYRLGITMMELTTLRTASELRPLRDEKQAGSKLLENLYSEIGSKYGGLFEQMMREMLSVQNRPSIDNIINNHLKDFMNQETPNQQQVDVTDKAVNIILDDALKRILNRNQNVEAFFSHYEMNTMNYNVSTGGFFHAMDDLNIKLNSNERALLIRSLNYGDTMSGELNLTRLMKRQVKGGPRMRELRPHQEESLRDLLKEIHTFVMEKNLELRKRFQRLDVKSNNFIDMDKFAELMESLKIDISNVDFKLLSDKYDPQDRGHIFYNSVCDDIDACGKQVEIDINSLLMEIYSIIRTRFNTLEDFFKKYDQAQSGFIMLQEFNTFLKDFNISPSKQILLQLYRKLDPENKQSVILIRIRNTFAPFIDKDVGTFLSSLSKCLHDLNTTFVQGIKQNNHEGLINIETLFEVMQKMGFNVKRPDLTFVMVNVKIERNKNNDIDVEVMREEFYKEGLRLQITNLVVFQGTNEIDNKPKSQVSDIYSRLIEKLRYKIQVISKQELIALFDISSNKDKFMNYQQFSDKIAEIDGTVEINEVKVIYSKLDANREEKVSSRNFLSTLGVRWEEETDKQQQRMKLAQLEDKIQGFDPEQFEPQSKMINQILVEVGKLNQVPGQYFKVKNGKLDQTDFRYLLKQVNVLPLDYKEEYDTFASEISYPTDSNQIDVDKLLRVLEYFQKKLKMIKSDKSKPQQSSPQRLVLRWFERLVAMMMKQKLDYFIFEDFDQQGYGFIRRHELEEVIFQELNLNDEQDKSFQLFVNAIKDDRSGDISLRKLKEGIEKERDALLLYEDLIELVKDQKMDVDHIFRNFDFNQSESMDLHEFERLVRTLQKNVNSQVVEVLFLKFDQNNDGSITLKEFRAKIFGQQVVTSSEPNNVLMQHFIEDVEDLINESRSSFDVVFKSFQGTIKVDDFRQALKTIGFNLDQEKIRLRLVLDLLNLQQNKVSMVTFKEFYSRYRKQGNEDDITFSKEDVKRVETFANQIEKKLMRIKKSFQEVFTSKLKVRDGCFKFEDISKIIQINLQMDDSLDLKMFLRYIQNTGGQNLVSVDQLERIIIKKRELSKDMFNQLLQFITNTNEIARELDMIDYSQQGYINPVDFRRVLRKLKGPLFEPDEIKLFCDKLGVLHENVIDYRELVVQSRKRFESSGMIGSQLQRACARIRQDLDYRGVDIVTLMKMYDKGNGRVRIAALLQELIGKNIYISENEQDLLFAVVRPDDTNSIDIHDLNKLIQMGTFDMRQNGKGYQNKKFVKFGDFESKQDKYDQNTNIKVSGSNIPKLIQLIQASVLKYMQDQGYNIRTLFRRLDKDNDDFLSYRELKGALGKLFGVQVSDEEFERVFEKFDLGRTFKLTLDEFDQAIYGEKRIKNDIETLIKSIKQKLWEQSINHDPTSQLIEIFNSIDSNNDGHISMSEFASTMRKLLPDIKKDDVEMVFKYFDRHNEDQFGYEAFMSVLREDHLNVDLIKSKIDAYLQRERLTLDDLFGMYANARGHLHIGDLGRMLNTVEFKIDERQLEEFFLMIDTQKDNNVTKAEFRAIVFNKQLDAQSTYKKLRRMCLANNFDLEMEFRKRDERNSGQVTLYSYNRMMQPFITQIRPYELELMFRQFDPKNTKVIIFKEFLEKVEAIDFEIEPIRKEINQALQGYKITEQLLLNSFDKNRDGCLSLEEFDSLLHSLNILLPTEEIQECFQTFDLDSTGQISLLNFSSVLKGNKASKRSSIHLILQHKQYNRMQVGRHELSETFFVRPTLSTDIVYQNNLQKIQLQQSQSSFNPNEYETRIRQACITNKRDPFDVFQEYDKTQYNFCIASIQDLEAIFINLGVQISRDHSTNFFYYYSQNRPTMPYIQLCIRLTSASVVFIKAILAVIKNCDYTLDTLFSSISQKKAFWTIEEFRAINIKLNLGITQLELQQVFDGWDLGRKGKITKEQVHQYLGTTKPKNTHLDEIYKELMGHLRELMRKDRNYFNQYRTYDTLKKGMITYYDFVNATKKLVPDISIEELQSLQQNLSKNNFVNLTELRTALKLTQEQEKSLQQPPKKQVQHTLQSMIQILTLFVTKSNRTMDDLRSHYYAKGVLKLDENTFLNLTLKLSSGLTQQQATELFYYLDVSATGSVSQSDFTQIMMPGEAKQLGGSDMTQSLDAEIKVLFDSVDENKNGTLEPVELHKALLDLGINAGPEELQHYFKLFDKDNNNTISYEEFASIIKDFLRKEINSITAFIVDLKREFKAIDTQNKRYLKPSQVKLVFKQLHLAIPDEDMDTLFKEIDQDKSGTVDIDEFIHFLQKNQSGMTGKAAQIVMNIKGSQHLSLKDLKAIFETLPAHFTQSFCRQQNKKKLNLPSSGLRPKVDPSGLFYSDLIYLKNVVVHPPMSVLEKQNINQKLLMEIQFVLIEGVPIADETKIERNLYVQREVACILYDRIKNAFIGNTVYLNTTWQPDYEDRWLFDQNVINSTLILKYNSFDDKKDSTLDLLVEMIVYIKRGEQVVELSCCHGQVPLANLFSTNGKANMELKGGAPNKILSIDKKDIRTSRSGWGSLTKALGPSIQTVLRYECHKITNPTMIKDLSVLSERCLLLKNGVNYMRSFREYFAYMSKVGGEIDTRLHYDSKMKALLNVMDCHNVSSQLFNFWNQKIEPKCNNFLYMFDAMSSLSNSLYLLLSSQDFKFQRQDPTKRNFDDQRRRTDMLDIVFSDVMTAMGVGVTTKKTSQSLGINLEPLNMMDMMDDEDDEEIMQIEKILARKHK